MIRGYPCGVTSWVLMVTPELPIEIKSVPIKNCPRAQHSPQAVYINSPLLSGYAYLLSKLPTYRSSSLAHTGQYPWVSMSLLLTSLIRFN